MKLKPILCLVSAAACCTISFTACRNVTNPGDNSSSATTDMNETTDTKTTEISKPTASETTLASSQKQQSEPTARLSMPVFISETAGLSQATTKTVPFQFIL